MQTRLPGELAAELEGIAGEYEADLVYYQQARCQFWPDRGPYKRCYPHVIGQGLHVSGFIPQHRDPRGSQLDNPKHSS